VYHYQNVLQTLPSNTEFTQRLHTMYAARLPRANGVLEDSTAFSALCKRQAAALSLCILTIIATAWRFW